MQVAAAVADPVRREILELLHSGPRSAGAIAAAFDISRPAVSRHLRVLRECGLVVAGTDAADGRGVVYRIETAPLAELDAWLARFRTAAHAQPTAGTDGRPLPRTYSPSLLDALDLEVRRTVRERRDTADPASPGAAGAGSTRRHDAGDTGRNTA